MELKQAYSDIRDAFTGILIAPIWNWNLEYEHDKLVVG